MTRLVILRPEPGATETLERARALGLDAIAMPLFDVEPLDWSSPDPTAFDGLLLTSANALRHAGGKLGQLRGLPVYAIGAATADAARKSGLDVVATGTAGVDRLLDSLGPDLKLLHLCGADRRDPYPPRQQLTAIAVYESRERAEVDLTSARGGVVLVHSPRAGRRFANLVADRSSIRLVAISEAAEIAVGQGWAEVRVAAQPSDESMLALAAPLCNKSSA